LTAAPKIAVVGSANVDLVARARRLPRPGETVGGASLERGPGGKGANQAVAAVRLGARTSFIGRIGSDDLVLRSLQGAGVDVSGSSRDDGESGLAVVIVDDAGENMIVVVAGANGRLLPEHIRVGAVDAVLVQLEIPDAAVRAAAQQADERGAFLCLNAAPARPLGELEPDLLVVNSHEHEIVGSRPGLVAVTLGAQGAVLLRDGLEIARAHAPRVEVVDTTGAGDAFCAALVVSLLEGRGHEGALRRACVAGALAVSRRGAQPAFPSAAEVDAMLAR
jgi:ribokinase